jgi:hypothetical protein
VVLLYAGFTVSPGIVNCLSALLDSNFRNFSFMYYHMYREVKDSF